MHFADDIAQYSWPNGCHERVGIGLPVSLWRRVAFKGREIEYSTYDPAESPNIRELRVVE